VSQIKANEKILKVTKSGLRKLKPFFNIKQFIGSGVNLTPSSRRRVKVFWHFYQTVGNFFSNFYTPITRSYLR